MKEWRTDKSSVVAGGRPRFELVAFEKIKLDGTAPYLVKGLIPRVGIVVVWGAPKCGKSFWTFDLSMHVALGWEYRGRRVHQGPVVYLALEGAAGFRARTEAFRQAKLLENAEQVPFYLVSAPIALVADQPALVASIRAALGAEAPAMIVIDTLNRSLAGSESDDRDMGAYIHAADVIRDTFDCAVVVVHHCGIDASRPRGHTSLAGAADAQISMKRDAADNMIATVEWMKDGPQGDEIPSRLRQIEVGLDEDGEPITSCIVEPMESSERLAKPDKSAKLTKGAKIALDAFEDALDQVGAEPPAAGHIPSNVRCVTLAQWREYSYRRGISASEEPRARQQAFKRASTDLIAGNVISVWDPYAWRVRSRV